MVDLERNDGSRTPNLSWAWRPAPADGGRDFGNANVFATPSTLDSLVREMGQNSLDAALDGRRVTLRFRLIDLRRGTPEFDAFVRAADLDDLLDHVEAASAARQKFAARLKSGLNHVRTASVLRLMRIDDYGTTGLEGDEDRTGDEKNQFAAFIRNNLDSAKTKVAGGSFGLGKATAWNCSRVFTVLVASRLHRTPPERAGLVRVIGKSELTWHQTNEARHAGPGWASDPARPFQSAWWRPSHLPHLQLDRHVIPHGIAEDDVAGTSILVVGFNDPGRERRDDLESADAVLQDLSKAAAEHFWPAMVDDRLQVVVEAAQGSTTVSTTTVDPALYVPSFVAAYRDYNLRRVLPEAREPGDVVQAIVPLQIQATRRGQAMVKDVPESITGQTHLVVRLATDDHEADSSREDHVALIRGAKMVVKYRRYKNVVMGGFPFHGLLLAGDAAEGAAHASHVEEFLRASEPPAHDDWRYDEDLASIYEKGTGERLKEFFRHLESALRQVVRRPEGQERLGPMELRSLLQTSRQGSPGSKSVASLASPMARIEGDRWKVASRVTVRPSTDVTRLRPSVAVAVEKGNPLRLAWEELTFDGRGVEGADAKGPYFDVAPAQKSVSFEGSAEKFAGTVEASKCKLVLSLDAKRVPRE